MRYSWLCAFLQYFLAQSNKENEVFSGKIQAPFEVRLSGCVWMLLAAACFAGKCNLKHKLETPFGVPFGEQFMCAASPQAASPACKGLEVV